jgi:thioredoxin-dependent peroxiredoxin
MKKKSKKAPAKKAAKKSPAKKRPAKKAAKKIIKKAVKKVVKKATKKTTPKKASAKKASAKKVTKRPVKKAIQKAKARVTKVTKVVKKVLKKTITKPVSKPKTKAKVAPQAPVAAPFKAYQSKLKAGDKAPYFEGIDQNGNTFSLSSLAGKKVILYFYPKDDTEGCTATACSLRDEYQFLGQKNYTVVGVSADDVESHAKFASKYELPFPLIADTTKTIINAYDVWGKKMLMGNIYDGIIRTTFIISEDGTLEQVIHSVDTKSHAQQILSL